MEDLFKQLLDAHAMSAIPKTHLIGIAVEVGDDKCDVKLEGEADLWDVQLHAIEDDLNSRIIIKPKEGSKVIIGFLNNSKTDAFIVQCSEIEEVNVKIDTLEFSIKSTGVLIKKGNDSLKIGLQKLVEAVQQIFVLYGNNPAYLKLQQALLIFNNLLR